MSGHNASRPRGDDTLYQTVERSKTGRVVGAGVFETGHPYLVAANREKWYCGYLQTADENDGDVDRDLYLETLDTTTDLNYGPDYSGWIGFDTAHARCVALDSDGELLDGADESDRALLASHSRKAIEWRPTDVIEGLRELAEQVDPPTEEGREEFPWVALEGSEDTDVGVNFTTREEDAEKGGEDP